jgi:hypothetical protein
MFTRMGDSCAVSTGNNRPVRNPQWEGSNVLEWRPRVIALVVVLVFIAVLMGLLDDPGPLNWEW